MLITLPACVLLPPFAGQTSNRCHRACHSCCRCLLPAGLVTEPIQREAVLRGCRQDTGHVGATATTETH